MSNIENKIKIRLSAQDSSICTADLSDYETTKEEFDKAFLFKQKTKTNEEIIKYYEKKYGCKWDEITNLFRNFFCCGKSI